MSPRSRPCQVSALGNPFDLVLTTLLVMAHTTAGRYEEEIKSSGT
jgi:hypothetical protein